MTFLERVHHEPDRCWVDVILFNDDDEARVTFVWGITASVAWMIACLGSIDVENRRNGVDVRVFLSSGFCCLVRRILTKYLRTCQTGNGIEIFLASWFYIGRVVI